MRFASAARHLSVCAFTLFWFVALCVMLTLILDRRQVHNVGPTTTVVGSKRLSGVLHHGCLLRRCTFQGPCWAVRERCMGGTYGFGEQIKRLSAYSPSAALNHINRTCTIPRMSYTAIDLSELCIESVSNLFNGASAYRMAVGIQH